MVCGHIVAEEELGDELLDEEHLDESYEGDDKPAAGDAKKVFMLYHMRSFEIKFM